MKETPRLIISKVFSKTPGPRYREWGDYSGQEFREDVFIPWLEANKDAPKLIVDMNGAIGYPSSFLEESFVGAIEEGFLEQIEKIEFIYDIDYRIDEVKGYITEAKERLSRKQSRA